MSLLTRSKEDLVNYFGIASNENEYIYLGKFARNKKCADEDLYFPSKIGKIIFLKTGNFFQGEISRQAFNGYGEFFINHAQKLKDHRFAYFIGEFKKQVSHGYVIENYNDEAVYEGYSEDGQKVLGRMYFSEGIVYEGEFQDNFFDGYVRLSLIFLGIITRLSWKLF